MHRANASAARNSAADGDGGPPKCVPTGWSLAQVFNAARNAGDAGLGSAPSESGFLHSRPTVLKDTDDREVTTLCHGYSMRALETGACHAPIHAGTVDGG
jgi:hypothetical protein